MSETIKLSLEFENNYFKIIRSGDNELNEFDESLQLMCRVVWFYRPLRNLEVIFVVSIALCSAETDVETFNFFGGLECF